MRVFGYVRDTWKLSAVRQRRVVDWYVKDSSDLRSLEYQCLTEHILERGRFLKRAGARILLHRAMPGDIIVGYAPEYVFCSSSDYRRTVKSLLPFRLQMRFVDTSALASDDILDSLCRSAARRR